MSTTVKAYGAKASDAPLKELEIERREIKAKDVKIKIDYCGVCHTDIHTVRDDWGGSKYPVVPGHEIIGTVEAIGDDVTQFKVGQKVGVGCMVDSCRTCASCQENLEQFCDEGLVGTYNGKDEHLGGHTFGGYSQQVVVDEHFVLNVPENLDLKATAPLLCAGITTWSPLRHWNVQKGDKVGVIGLGGLGHMGIKFANALGAHVVMITRSQDKAQDAKDLGVHEVLISKDEEQMQKHLNSFDFLLNTIPVKHDMNPYLALLKRDKTMVLVGAIEPLEPLHGASLILARKRVSGSLIGGIKETQEMLDFCGEHNITSDVEMINMQNINKAYDRVTSSDVKYRFVIDMESLS